MKVMKAFYWEETIVPFIKVLKVTDNPSSWLKILYAPPFETDALIDLGCMEIECRDTAEEQLGAYREWLCQ